MSNVLAVEFGMHEREGRIWADSRMVADKFRKDHKHVLRDIRELECTSEFHQSNFGPVSYLDNKGESRPMYEMTRDGFTYLAMGFTGKEAAIWKEKYIAAFNAMEAELLNRNINPAIGFPDMRFMGGEFGDGIMDSVSSRIGIIFKDVVKGEVEPLKKIIDKTHYLANQTHEAVSFLANEKNRERRGFGPKTQRIWIHVLNIYFGCRCPVCQDVVICDETKLWRSLCDLHHGKHNPKLNKEEDGMPVCKTCHKHITLDKDDWIRRSEDAFNYWVKRVRQFTKKGKNIVPFKDPKQGSFDL